VLEPRHSSGDETGWWEKLGLNSTGAARALWLTTHPQPQPVIYAARVAEQIGDVLLEFLHGHGGSAADERDKNSRHFMASP
jgi:hypothetical protein